MKCFISDTLFRVYNREIITVVDYVLELHTSVYRERYRFLCICGRKEERKRIILVDYLFQIQVSMLTLVWKS